MNASSAIVVFSYLIPLPPHRTKQNKTPTGEASVHPCLGDRKKSVPVRHDYLIYFTLVN